MGVKTQSVGLGEEQLRWLRENPNFNLSKFVRAKLSEHIQLKEEIKEACQSDP